MGVTLHCRDDHSEFRLIEAERLWLFLDYDGTLAEFAETPDEVVVRPEIADLMARLVELPGVRVSVVSGRRLDQIRKLVPVPGIFLAGTYGIECRTFEGEEIQRLEFESVRPILERFKPRLEELIEGEEGFFLEDKGWSLALHGRYATDEASKRVLQVAEKILSQGIVPGELMLLGGHKFLEVCPVVGNKGETIRFLLAEYPWPGARLAYLGDDDKDEQAFQVIKEHGGLSIRVGDKAGKIEADCWLENPEAARRWLDTLIQRRENGFQSSKERNASSWAGEN